MNSGRSMTKWLLSFLGIASTVSAAPIVIVGTLGDVHGNTIRGTISVYETVGGLSSSHHITDEMGGFRIDADSSRNLIIHAQTPNHSPREVLVSESSEGVVLVAIALPVGQTVRGQIVDSFGNEFPGATVMARYHEPDKPIRRVLLDEGSVTDESGEFVLGNVGVDVPFYIDVLAPGYPPSHSKLLELGAGETEVDSIVLQELGATVVVRVLDKSGHPVAGVPIFLFADTSHFIPSARGSWLFPMGIKKSLEASRFGSARFTGVPPGVVTVRAKTSNASLEGTVVAVANQEVSLTLVDPQ